MESLSFKNIPVRIGTDLHNLKFMPTISANFSTSNNLNQIKGLGYYNSYRIQFPSSNITNNFSIQYIVQDSDPIKPIIDSLKTGALEEVQTYYIDAGGLTLSGAYLDNFSMSITPLLGITAQASFISFSPFKGQIGKKIQFDKIYTCFTGTSYSPSQYYNTFNEYIMGGTGCLLKNLFYKNEFQSGVSESSSDTILVFDNASFGAGIRNFYLHSSNIWREQSLGTSSQENAIIQSGSVILLKNLSTLSPKSIQPNIILERSPVRHIVNPFGVWIEIKENPLYTYEDNRISYINQNSANPIILSSGNIEANFLHGNSTSFSMAPQSINNVLEDSSEEYSLVYNFRSDYLPISTLGTSYPKVIKYNGGTEELEITENLYRRILYSGDTRSISLNLKPICCLDTNYIINMNNAQSIISNGSSQNNGVVITTRKFTKQY